MDFLCCETHAELVSSTDFPQIFGAYSMEKVGKPGNEANAELYASSVRYTGKGMDKLSIRKNICVKT